MAQVTLLYRRPAPHGHLTLTPVREMRLEKGQIAARWVKSTDVMVMRAR